MGRYYNGDIEGKFWFAVQNSNDADFFGVEGTEPSELNYYFDEDDLSKIEKGVKVCLKELGEYKEKLDEFFKEKVGYNDEKLAKALKIDEIAVKSVLKWYARLELGEKILKCVKLEGSCNFTAEC